MANKKHIVRMVLLAVGLSLAYVGLGARLVVLQVVNHEKYASRADHKRVFRETPRRGDILDRHGNPLATSIPVKRVFANPSFIGGHYPEVAHALAPLLQYETPELTRLLQPTVRTNQQGRMVTNAWVDLKRKLGLEEWQQVTQTMLGLRLTGEPATKTSTERLFYQALRQQGVYAEDDQERVYPHHRLAAHVLGFVQEELTNINSVAVTELVGRYGIEQWFDAQLKGVHGWRLAETDPRRREIVIYREQEVEAEAGLNVVLTIDSVVQSILEQELSEVMHKHKPLSASAMVVRPRTGEILGMAVLPNFDPNRPGKATFDQMRNRIIADTYEPGSVFKIVALCAGLNEGRIRLTDYINCENGLWRYAGRPLRDHGRYKVIPVEMVVAKSSNIGFAKIGLMLGEEGLYNYMKSFGFDGRTEIPLKGEVGREIPKVKKWDKLKITRMPIGQGVVVTHIQMIMAMSAVANEGRLMRPMLVRRLEYPNGEVFADYQPQMVRQVVSARAARQATIALKTVVSTNGTALKAALEHYTVAGKTGTAEKVKNGVYVDEYVASFFGFLPADDPEVCISVVIDQPEVEMGYYGGQTAAPAFKAIAEQVAKYLKLRPDKPMPTEETTPSPLPSVEQVRTGGAAPPRNL